MTSSAQNSKQSLAQQGSATVPAYSFLGDQDTGTYRSAANEWSIATNATQRVVVNSSGYVGIGISSPTAPLNVKSNQYPQSKIAASSGEVDAAIEMIPSGALARNYRLIAGGGIFQIEDVTDASARLAISSTGNVGIGTKTPDALLTVNTIASFGDGAVTTPSIAHKGDLNTGLWFPAADTIAASTAGTERMRITSAGYVGIGTSSPPAPLSITSSLSAALSSVSAYGLYIYPTSSGTTYIDSLNANPNGANIALRTFDGTSIYTTTIAQAGAAYQGNNSSLWSVVSDINIKTNIRSIGSALEKIIALMPRHFEYKDKLGKVRTGFIAQEFEEVFPGHVGELDVPDQYKQYLAEGAKIKTIDPDLIPYIVAAIQELSAKVAALESK